MFTKSAECTDSCLLAPASSRIVPLQWVSGWSSASSSHWPNPPGWCLAHIFCRCWLTPRRELLLECLEHEWKDNMASAGEAFREHTQYIVPKGKAWLLKKADPQSSPRAPTKQSRRAHLAAFSLDLSASIGHCFDQFDGADEMAVFWECFQIPY